MSFCVDVITLFPELFEPFFSKGLLGQAQKSGLIDLHTINPRQFTEDIHKTVDDRPYGGGDGMIMMCEPLEKAIQEAQKTQEGRPVIVLTPQGQTLTTPLAKELSTQKGLIFVCGRYGGIDERFTASFADYELSIGDYILNGGEVAAMATLESVFRFLPGALGNELSSSEDSYSCGVLEAPQMTRPLIYKGLKVPEVLISGHHQNIATWRQSVGLLRTLFRRPDLLDKAGVSEGAKRRALDLYKQMSPEERKSCGLPLDPN